MVTRLLWTLVGASLLSWAFELETGAPRYFWAALLALIAGIWGLGAAIVSWWPARPTGTDRLRNDALAWTTALLTVACFCAWSVLQIHGAPAYGTDELAFDQYAGQLLQHGMNPYVHSMGPSFPLFRVSPGGYTYTLAGARVTQLSYPALSFLIYLPFLWLGWSRQLAPGVDVIGWSLAILLMFWMLPRSLRPGALILGGFGAYINLAVIGLTDMAFMPLLVLAAYRWDRFDGRSWRSYIGPVAFGLAMASKQTPWPVLPFILVALVCEHSAGAGPLAGALRAGRYLGATLAAFLIPNLPFIVASPSAWANGTIAPLANSLVPAGQGGIGFSLFLRIGGGSLFAFTLLSILVLVLLLVAYVGTYPLLKPATFVLPALAYFFAVRSYAIYLVALVPPALVAAATTVTPQRETPRTWEPFAWARSRAWGIATAGLGAVSAGVLAYALLAGPPLGVRILNVQPSGSNLAQAVTVRVTNHTASPKSPAFTLQTPSGVTSFWHKVGPRSIPAGASATYTLYSPNTPSEQSVNSGITVLAFLSSPGSVSVSPLYAPPVWHIGFDPESFDQILPVGSTVRVQLQLLDQWDAAIHRGGVPVTISQTTTGRSDVLSLDGAPPGGSTTVVTDARGTASITIRDLHGSTSPVMLTARPVNGEFGHVSIPSPTLELRFSSL
jgi:uncharacterized membrane protein